jgi:replicative DNA helicase
MNNIDQILRQEELKRAAKDYISRNLSVIPVGANKIPVISWKEFCDRIATPEEVDEWFTRFPNAQIGMVCGKISGLTVVDVESEGGEEEWKKLPQNCPIVRTGSGGRHYWYLYDSSFKNAVRIDGQVKHTDIRNDGGYVVLPPSISDKGAYAWVQKMPPCEFPKHLFKPKNSDSPSYVSSQLNKDFAMKLLANLYEGSGTGARNESMVKYIGYCLTQIHPDDWENKVWPLAQEANLKNNPPLPINELRKSYDSIRQAEKTKSPDRFMAPAQQTWEIANTDDEVKLLSEVAQAQTIDLSKPLPSGIAIFDQEIRGGFFPGDLIIVGAGSGEGKCHGKGTKILMFDGSIKNVEDVVVGDKLMGDDSTARNVLSLAKGREEMYEISHPKNKTDKYVVNKSHILSLWNGVSRYGGLGKKDISVKEYLKQSDRFRRFHYGYKVGVEFKEKEVDIDPYFIGLWLGDGTSSDVGITTMDNEIIEYLTKYSKKLGLSVTVREQKNNKSSVYSLVRPKNFLPTDKRSKRGYGGIISLKEKIGALGLINNKHIPELYKINSRDNRLKLLAGLIDSDGYMNHNNYEICIKGEKLANDIVYLCRSLGVWSYYTIKHNKRFNKDYFRVKIYGSHLEEVPVLLGRKKCSPRKQIKNALHYGIQVKKIGVDNYYGFVLDGNFRYLLGDFSVTHNTSFCQYLSYNFLKHNKEKVLFFSYEVMSQFVWEKFEKMGLAKEDLIYMPFKHTTGNVGWVEKKIKEAKEKYGTKMIVIDHLGYLESRTKTTKAMGENYSLQLTTIVRELKKIAIAEEVVIVMPVHVRKRPSGEKKGVTNIDMDDIAYSSGVYQEADIVFLIKREETPESNTMDLFTNYSLISMAKNRRGGRNPRGWFTLVKDVFIHDATYRVPPSASTVKITRENAERELEKIHKEQMAQASMFGERD